MASAYDLATTPAAPPPEGVTPNLIDPQTEWDYLLPTCIVAWTFCVPAVLLRIFTKLRVHGRLQHEDYVLCLALAGLINWTVLLLVQPTKGAHIWDTSIADLQRFAYWSNLIIILYVPAILLAKYAILLQLSRIFSVQPRTGTWWLIRALIWTASVFYIIVWGFDIFQCSPRAKIWNPELPGTCWSVEKILIATALFNVVLNGSILVLPLVILKRLQMNSRKKLTVSAIFAVAGLASVSSIMRTVYSFIFASNQDKTRTIFPVAMWAVAEIACIIFATTFPSMPLIYTYLRGGRQAARRKTGYASKSQAANGARGGGGLHRQTSSVNRTSFRRDTLSGPWFPLNGLEADAEIKAQNESWDRLPSKPEPIAMRTLEDASGLRQDPARRAAVSRSASLGGIGVTKTFEVQITNMV